jgi:hypothetical protein
MIRDLQTRDSRCPAPGMASDHVRLHRLDVERVSISVSPLSTLESRPRCFVSALSRFSAISATSRPRTRLVEQVDDHVAPRASAFLIGRWPIAHHLAGVEDRWFDRWSGRRC